MAQNDIKSIVDIGAEQRGGSWPKPGEEGFVHPDGTEQSVRQWRENEQARLSREADGSPVHGAPGQGGVQPVPVTQLEPTPLDKARAEQTQFVQEGLAALGDEQASTDESSKGRHESAKSAESRGSTGG